MEYLFLSFKKSLNSSSTWSSEFYKDSLNDQYSQISKRIPSARRERDFVSFIENIFPSGRAGTYYLSCPNFLREKRTGFASQDNSSNYYLNNVVIRPEKTINSAKFLPNNQNIILIGDLHESGKLSSIEIKGIQLIDDVMKSENDMVLKDVAVCNYFENSWSLSSVNYNDSVLTPNRIKDLISDCYTVSDPYKVRKTYEEWAKYFKFREYYLDEQSKRNFYLHRVEYINAYAINRKEYKRNEEIYGEFLLDKHLAEKKGNMVLLSKKIGAAEELPLIRLDIERNNKSFKAARIRRGNNFYSEEDRKIRSLSRDNVIITARKPQEFSEAEGNRRDFLDLLKDGYELGDRFSLVVYDVEPKEHLEELEQNFNISLEQGRRQIKRRYEQIVEKELEDAIQNKQSELETAAQKEIQEIETKLTNKLDDDVAENKDPQILKRVKEEKKQKEKKIKDLRKKIKKSKSKKTSEYSKQLQELETAPEVIDIRGLYLERNEQFLNDYQVNKNEEIKKELKTYRKQKEQELSNKYQDDIRCEQKKEQTRMNELHQKQVQKICDDETIRRYSLYFTLNNNVVINDKIIEKINDCKYIVYDSRAEKAKIKRQKEALENFMNGYVKNPYLSTYLFDSEKLGRLSSVSKKPLQWYLDSLNEKQKEAVTKAVASNGLFLLQGPPGTGKTQVIAEIVAQLVKKGKKVLISSETHKAIDNVFERLPKIADIVPVRLIPTSNEKGKENNYDPKYLVDTFYGNIADRMKRDVAFYNNFQKNKKDFADKMKEIKFAHNKFQKNRAILDANVKANEELSRQAKKIRDEIASLKDKKDDVQEIIARIKRTQKRYIARNIWAEDADIDAQVFSDYRNELEKKLNADERINHETPVEEATSLIETFSLSKVNEILAFIDPKTKKVKLQMEKNQLSKKMKACKNDVDEVLPEKQQEYFAFQKELKDVINQINSSQDSSDDDGGLSRLFDYQYLFANLEKIENDLDDLKQWLERLKSNYDAILDMKLKTQNDKKANFDAQITEKNSKIRELNDSIEENNKRQEVQELENLKTKLTERIGAFFRDFNISEPYKDIDDAIAIIEDKWRKLEEDFEAKKLENEKKIPVYEKIARYITSQEVINADRAKFTGDLFANSNVFGITCTSNDRFTKANLAALGDYNIEEGIDIKKAGIDVVIIDEVSKSSFIDLLIPILYGKTVILVGDHRQLPPMYEFAKLKDDDFKGLDAEIINASINKRFKELYEECFFKTLFENIPSKYKTMLEQQYRCHEDIMRVFNHFYQGQLKMGWDGQNNMKQHNAEIFANGIKIIDPTKHIYFIDCREKEAHEEDSTSIFNKGEADVVVELIRRLNEYFEQHPDKERLSIGVISTYGDQARRIKKRLKSEHIETNGFRADSEKMIVSTVDDFQGDERDIIILTTVRNPENPARSDPGFILAYQRINVSLSRARRLLIVVGNRDYLESKGVIDLPDVYGNAADDVKNLHIYQEIIRTIELYGEVIDGADVLKEGR